MARCTWAARGGHLWQRSIKHIAESRGRDSARDIPERAWLSRTDSVRCDRGPMSPPARGGLRLLVASPCQCVGAGGFSPPTRHIPGLLDPPVHPAHSPHQTEHTLLFCQLFGSCGQAAVPPVGARPQALALAEQRAQCGAGTNITQALTARLTPVGAAIVARQVAGLQAEAAAFFVAGVCVTVCVCVSWKEGAQELVQGEYRGRWWEEAKRGRGMRLGRGRGGRGGGGGGVEGGR